MYQAHIKSSQHSLVPALYRPSTATTYIKVGNEASTSVAPAAAPLSVADTYSVPAIAGLFLTIILTTFC
jgi:hypothetical protein